MTTRSNPKIRVLHVDDDSLTRSLAYTVLVSFEYSVMSVSTATEFMMSIEEFDPHVVVVDLDLGVGPTGVQLLQIVERDMPWIGKVVVSAHRSPRLVDSAYGSLRNVSYLVKADISTSEQIKLAIEASLAGQVFVLNESSDTVHLTHAQADVLRLIAEGKSNEAIAVERGCSLRGVERIISRTFQTLGVGSDSNFNPRVAAARMLSKAHVTVTE